MQSTKLTFDAATSEVVVATISTLGFAIVFSNPLIATGVFHLGETRLRGLHDDPVVRLLLRYKDATWIAIFNTVGVLYLLSGLLDILNLAQNGTSLIIFANSLLLVNISTTVVLLVWLTIRPNIYTFSEVRKIRRRSKRYITAGLERLEEKRDKGANKSQRENATPERSEQA